MAKVASAQAKVTQRQGRREINRASKSQRRDGRRGNPLFQGAPSQQGFPHGPSGEKGHAKGEVDEGRGKKGRLTSTDRSEAPPGREKKPEHPGG